MLPLLTIRLLGDLELHTVRFLASSLMSGVSLVCFRLLHRFGKVLNLSFPTVVGIVYVFYLFY